MAIDPDIYEKYSGRKLGEAERNMQETLAESAAERAEMKSLAQHQTNGMFPLLDLAVVTWAKRHPIAIITIFVAIPVTLRILFRLLSSTY